MHNQPWMKGLWDLHIEAQQAHEEGKDLSSVQAELTRLQADRRNPALYGAADQLYARIQSLPDRAGFPYHEPDDWAGIQAALPPGPDLPPFSLQPDQLDDRLLGAWQGRCAGCLLGQPVEGWMKERITGFLKDTANLPISRYLSSNVPETLRERYQLQDSPGGYGAPYISWINHITEMPEDDDLNYTLLALKTVELHGRDFTTLQLALEWLSSLPLLRTCTAERVAYLNLSRLIPPPQSARHSNPFREWIGAQIRADFYGYINPGQPRAAAEMAWRDAVISRVKNGIYGTMFAAAMIAAAFVSRKPEDLVRAGLAQIPAGSRLYEKLSALLDNWANGLSKEDFLAAFYREYDDRNPHHWCHTIPNALLVAAGLLYNGMDFVSTIGFAVESGFDTDCNAATLGSILGAALGSQALPEDWIRPLNNKIRSCVSGYDGLAITELAERTRKLLPDR